MNKLDYFVSKAIHEARKSAYKFRLGAVVVRENKVISQGFNIVRQGHILTTHAEEKALVRVNGADAIVVVRIMRNGCLTMALPCKSCMKHISHKGIKHIYYSDWFGKIQRMRIW